MKTSESILKLFDAFERKDDTLFELVALSIIAEERTKKHDKFANELQEKLNKITSKKKGMKDFFSFINDVPLDNERNLPLLEIKKPNRYLADLVLEKKNISIIERVILENHKADVLGSYGLEPIQKIIFYGPPGCGKTATAEAIAKEIELPFATLKLSSFFSKFLGDTSYNLSKIFNFITKNQVVILFDEFDSIGKDRSIDNDVGESRRIVNTLLQMLDSYEGKSILIFATNLEKDLDYAIWRRFDEILKFDLPNEVQIKQLLEIKLRSIKNNILDKENIVKKFNGLNHAEIEKIIIKAIKSMILNKREILEMQDIFEFMEK